MNTATKPTENDIPEGINIELFEELAQSGRCITIPVSWTAERGMVVSSFVAEVCERQLAFVLDLAEEREEVGMKTAEIGEILFNNMDYPKGLSYIVYMAHEDDGIVPAFLFSLSEEDGKAHAMYAALLCSTNGFMIVGDGQICDGKASFEGLEDEEDGDHVMAVAYTALCASLGAKRLEESLYLA